MATETNTPGSRPSRRTIVKGAAWAVPVVTVASAAPAMAASQEVTITGTGLACKSPGGSCNKPPWYVNKGYFISVNVCTDVRADVSVDFGDATVTLDGVTTSGWDVNPDPLTIAYNGEPGTRCAVVVLGLTGEENSSNVAISGSAPFEWTAENGLSGSGTMTFSAAATPPCDDCGVMPSPNSVGTTATDTAVEEPAVEGPAVETVEAPAVEAPAVETVDEPVVEAPAVEETEPVEEQTVDTAEVTSAPDVSTDESTENN